MNQYELLEILKKRNGWHTSREISKIVFEDETGTHLRIINKKLGRLIKTNFVEKKKLTTDWEKNIYGNTFIYRANPNIKYED